MSGGASGEHFGYPYTQAGALARAWAFKRLFTLPARRRWRSPHNGHLKPSCPLLARRRSRQPAAPPPSPLFELRHYGRHLCGVNHRGRAAGGLMQQPHVVVAERGDAHDLHGRRRGGGGGRRGAREREEPGAGRARRGAGRRGGWACRGAGGAVARTAVLFNSCRPLACTYPPRASDRAAMGGRAARRRPRPVSMRVGMSRGLAPAAVVVITCALVLSSAAYTFVPGDPVSENATPVSLGCISTVSRPCLHQKEAITH
jgi:hypothetical protein